ncbi:MAG: PIN domain-containing protein [Thiohalomonadales bacterium]
MIAIDTNVLLRYLLQDDLPQSKKAVKIISGTKNILVTDVVLIETLWTLQGKKYRLKKDDLLLVIQQLFVESNLQFEDGQTVWRALNLYRNAVPVRGEAKKRHADFADALIYEKSIYLANKLGESYGGFYTFDTAAQQFPEVLIP